VPGLELLATIRAGRAPTRLEPTHLEDGCTTES
jgi:hypothetical protein